MENIKTGSSGVEKYKIFIGYDFNESVAFHVLCYSIMKYASRPVSITPVFLGNLDGVYKRPDDDKSSNAFSFSRFLVPYLSKFAGRSLFMDCDMFLRCDITELFDACPIMPSVNVVKHDYTPKGDTKYLDNKQHKYEKKNWSSLMMFNNNHFHTKLLTPEYVNNATGLQLHQFKWTDEALIGDIDINWNWLVDEYPSNEDAKIVHYTNGGPWFYEYRYADYASEWNDLYREMVHATQRNDFPTPTRFI